MISVIAQLDVSTGTELHYEHFDFELEYITFPLIEEVKADAIKKLDKKYISIRRFSFYVSKRN
jgi:hypothetical protein